MDSIIILLLAILTIILLRKLLCAFPEKYFIIQDIITTKHNEINIFGFLLRFLLILIVSIVIIFIYKGDIKFVIEYSIFVSFLPIWPFILEQIIYRNKTYEKFYSIEKMTNEQIKKYLIVYFMYSVICTLVSLISMPIYNLINNNPIKLYKYILGKYLLLDQLQQNIISNIIAGIILAIFIFFIKSILTKVLKSSFK